MADGAMAEILRLESVRRSFRQAGTELTVLRGVDLAIEAGTLAALVGPSGAGKSTLLHVSGLLERPDGGRVVMEGRDVGRAGDRERTRLRCRHIGFVYQFHHLLPDFTALENVAMPQLLAGSGRAAANARAAELLERLGLAERLGHRPGRLSGGEQQRVAIARALANRPALLLADEPTGNLDIATAEDVFATLLAITRTEGTAALVATHNLDLAARMDVTWRLRDGKLQAQTLARAPIPA